MIRRIKSEFLLHFSFVQSLKHLVSRKKHSMFSGCETSLNKSVIERLVTTVELYRTKAPCRFRKEPFRIPNCTKGSIWNLRNQRNILFDAAPLDHHTQPHTLLGTRDFDRFGIL